jgi:hypothetical protein
MPFNDENKVMKSGNNEEQIYKIPMFGIGKNDYFCHNKLQAFDRYHILRCNQYPLQRYNWYPFTAIFNTRQT